MPARLVLFGGGTLSILIEAIRTVARGDAPLAPSVTRRLVEEFARRPAAPSDPSPAFEALTDREREAFHHLGRGLTNAETPRSSSSGRRP